MTRETTPLRIFYLEDDPLIIIHVEAMIEGLGHIFAGSADSFAEPIQTIDALEVDGVLVDIDLADGRTGADAAAWLRERGIPALFSHRTGADRSPISVRSFGVRQKTDLRLGPVRKVEAISARPALI